MYFYLPGPFFNAQTAYPSKDFFTNLRVAFFLTHPVAFSITSSSLKYRGNDLENKHLFSNPYSTAFLKITAGCPRQKFFFHYCLISQTKCYNWSLLPFCFSSVFIMDRGRGCISWIWSGVPLSKS